MKKKFFMILWGFSTIFGASCSNGTDETNETWTRSLGWEDTLEKEMATHSNIFF